MKVTIESTTQIVMLDGAPTRVWEGETESGIRVNCFIRRVQAQFANAAEGAQFECELEETRPPAVPSARIRELKDDVIERCLLERTVSGAEFKLELDLTAAFAIIGNIQLALRHPQNTGAAADIGREMIHSFIAKLIDAGLTAHAELALLGDDPLYDEPEAGAAADA